MRIMGVVVMGNGFGGCGTRHVVVDEAPADGDGGEGRDGGGGRCAVVEWISNLIPDPEEFVDGIAPNL